jgi:CBS domain-containing protein
MNQHRIGSLVVLDDEQAPLGIITERDILTRVVAAARDPAQTPVRDVMTSRLITCSVNTPLDELRSLMRRERIRHVPVVEDKRVCAMISIGDLNTAEVKVMHETIKYFEQYIYGG